MRFVSQLAMQLRTSLFSNYCSFPSLAISADLQHDLAPGVSRLRPLVDLGGLFEGWYLLYSDS